MNQFKRKEIERKITKKTKVILPVHWGGASPDMYEIVKIAKKYKIYEFFFYYKYNRYIPS